MLDPLDAHVLAAAVRRALGHVGAEIGAWTAAPLGGGHTDAAVYRLAGEARVADRVRSWSLILKRQAAPAPAGLAAAARDPRAPNYWRREAEAYRSGLLDELAGVPGGLAPARCFAVEENPAGVELWLEDVAAADPAAGHGRRRATAWPRATSAGSTAPMPTPARRPPRRARSHRSSGWPRGS
jgi:hypothetical protein